jgi:HEPN domain-containing protein
MPDRSADWLAQAKRDLEHARKDVADAYYEHACFGAQQAAEKAAKSVYQRAHADAWGHVVSKLLRDVGDVLGTPAPKALVNDARILDQYHVATRYPNGFDSGAPMDFYTHEQAEDAVRRAERIIQWCEGFSGT